MTLEHRLPVLVASLLAIRVIGCSGGSSAPSSPATNGPSSTTGPTGLAGGSGGTSISGTGGGGSTGGGGRAGSDGGIAGGSSGGAMYDAGDAAEPSWDFVEVPCSVTAPPGPILRECSALCGNRTIDVCRFACDLNGACAHVGEVCDGAIATTATCESVGYSGGTLKCGAWCGFDVADCTSCPQDQARVVACA